jgi:hypothetical protein
MTLQLLRFTEYVTEKDNERAFFDVSKAYDVVWTTGLIYKLHTAGIPDSVLLLLASYLTDRKFRVKMGKKNPNGSRSIGRRPGLIAL